ncbi:MAG: MmgE/PrpD family protein [Victivallales bacterium]|nr:MmgE/PrpD family protein [Victivallales bacterium]
MDNGTDSFIEYLFGKSAEIRPQVISRAMASLADYIAVTEAGAHCSKDAWREFLSRTSGRGNAPVVGYGMRADAPTACLVNGYNAHCLELDDGQRFAMLHLGSCIITALISAASEHSIGTAEFLAGLIMGCEAACRLAITIQPGHKKKGFHAAGTCGTVGSAVAVAFALRMEVRRMKTVLSAALGSAAGMLEMQAQGSRLKPYNLGRAAMDGLAAAYMGFTELAAPDDILGGARGFLKLFTDEYDLRKLTAPADYFELERTYVKPYAACRHCHSAIEAALSVRGKIPPDDISGIRVKTYRLAIKGHDHTEIAGVSAAKQSIPYSVAAAMILGYAGMQAFSEDAVRRGDILRLAAKVSVEEAPLPPSLPSDARYATVVLEGKDGSVFSGSVEYAKGDPENPMGHDELSEKITSLLQYAGCDGTLLASCRNLLDGKMDVAQLLSVL